MDNPKLFTVVNECGMPVTGAKFSAEKDANDFARVLNTFNDGREFKVLPIDSPVNYVLCPTCGKQFHIAEYGNKAHTENCIPQA